MKGVRHARQSTAVHSPGWVEGLEALSDSCPATSLMVSDGGGGAPAAKAAAAAGTAAAQPPSPSNNNNSNSSSNSRSSSMDSVRTTDGGGGGCDVGGVGGCDVGGAPDPKAATAASLVEQAACAMLSELETAGEALMQLGMPGAGWGPAPLTAPAMDSLLDRLRRAADAAGAELTVLRERPLPAGASGEGEGREGDDDGGARRIEDAVAAAAAADTAPAGDQGAPQQRPLNPPSSSSSAGRQQQQHQQQQHVVADVLARKRPGTRPLMEVRCAIVGNVDAGKSTLVGCLTRGQLDDGRGSARSKVFSHRHEEATGRTSSIGQHTLCLDAGGAPLNDPQFRSASCASYVARSAKVVTLVDLAGHERYFRQAAYGLTGHLPDVACMIVGANAGVVGMAKEHLGVALALRVPTFFVVTKTDLAPAHVLRETVSTLAALLRRPGVRRRPLLVRDLDDALLAARGIAAPDAAVAPIFLTSAVSGSGLGLVRAFFNLLPQRQRWHELAQQPAELLIDEVFGVPGVGTVVAGTVKRGFLTAASRLVLGPDIGNGEFVAAQVRSIHVKRLPVDKAVAGQTAAVALKRVKRAQVRKGMVLVDPKAGGPLGPRASWEFDADVAILTHATTIAPRYQAIVHCEAVQHAARVVAMDREVLRSGDRARVRLRFLHAPQWLAPGLRFLLREGRTKGIGLVVACEGASESWS